MKIILIFPHRLLKFLRVRCKFLIKQTEKRIATRKKSRSVLRPTKRFVLISLMTTKAAMKQAVR